MIMYRSNLSLKAKTYYYIVIARRRIMQLKQVVAKINQVLFSGNILKLLFSYKGCIGRVPYVLAIFLFWLMINYCVFDFFSYTIIFLLQIYCATAVIQKRSRSFGSTGTWYILTNVILIYTMALTFDIDVSFFPVIKWCIYIVMTVATIANLILVIRPSKQDVDEQKRSFLTRFPIIFTIVVFVGIFGMFELKDKYMPDTNRPAFHLGLAVGEIYRHTYAYPEFCKAQGYEMVSYPDKVREKFKEEIEIVENDQLALLARAANIHYKDIHAFYKNNYWGPQEERLKAPLDFFESLRKRMIILEVAEEQNVSTDEVKLTKEDNERISLKDACKVVDEDAEYFVSMDCPFNYILKYARGYSNCGTYYNTIE